MKGIHSAPSEQDMNLYTGDLFMTLEEAHVCVLEIWPWLWRMCLEEICLKGHQMMEYLSTSETELDKRKFPQQADINQNYS